MRFGSQFLWETHFLGATQTAKRVGGSLNIPGIYKAAFDKQKASQRQIESSYMEWEQVVRQIVLSEFQYLQRCAEVEGQKYYLIDRRPGAPGADQGYDQLGLHGRTVRTGNAYADEGYESEIIHPANISFLINKRGLLNVVLQPARSTTSTLPNEPILIYYSYKPTSLTKLKLRQMLATYLWFERCTMFYGSRTLFDSLKLRWFSHMDARTEML